jgi:hypothetical protein
MNQKSYISFFVVVVVVVVFAFVLQRGLGVQG